MPRKPPGAFQAALAQRLKAVQAEMDKADREMAAIVGVPRSRWANWKSAGNKPDEAALCRLWRPAKVTMEWLYCGDASRMELGHAIRLAARILGENPATATAEVLERAASVQAPVLALDAPGQSKTEGKKKAATSSASSSSRSRVRKRTADAPT